MRPKPIPLIPDRFHRIAVSVSHSLLSVPISLSRCTDCGDYWNRIISWVRICVARCGTFGRTAGIRLGWHGGVFVRTFLIIVGHVHSKASSKVAVLPRRNDIISAHLWHFSTLRLVPIDLYTCRVSHVSCPYAAARWVQPSFGAAVSGLPQTVMYLGSPFGSYRLAGCVNFRILYFKVGSPTFFPYL